MNYPIYIYVYFNNQWAASFFKYKVGRYISVKIDCRKSNKNNNNSI